MKKTVGPGETTAAVKERCKYIRRKHYEKDS